MELVLQAVALALPSLYQVIRVVSRGLPVVVYPMSPSMLIH
jgi:hypothetical protein